MYREQAHEYLKLYLKFLEADTGVKVVDADPATGEVEIKYWDRRMGEVQEWTDLWTAAKIIEARSCKERAPA